MKLVWILPRINICTFKVLWRLEQEAAVIQKHYFSLQSTKYFCVSVECICSVLNHSYASRICLTFGVLEHVYKERVGRHIVLRTLS